MARGPRAAPVLAAVLAIGASTAARAQWCPGPTLAGPQGPPAAMPWMDPSLSAEARTELLLSAMALEEKVDLATGERCLVYGYYDAPIDRLGIPALTMTDGPAGIRIPYQRVNGGRATQLPAPIGVAATWDVALAWNQGDVLGGEAFATGHNVLLGPTLDIARNPLAGRTFEGLGEDPLLASRMGVAIIQGIQSHAVLADAKHWAVYGREDDRWTLDAHVDERTLREIYLRPFESAAREGHVASVMCAFNRVNGAYSCEDPLLLGQVLERDMGFDGFVLSDWGAIHGTVPAALAGLDLELAFAKYFGWSLWGTVKSGEVPAAVVDEMARRILRSMFRGGLFDHRVEVAPLPEASDSGRSREIAEQGAVLLANGRGLLPLQAGAVGSIAVIGADAANASAQGGGAARVEPTFTVSPLDGVRARAGAGVRVGFAEGGDPVVPADLLPGPPAVPSSVLSPPGDPGSRGLRAEYWGTNASFSGAPDDVRLDRKVAASSGFFAYPSINASSVPALPSWYALSPFSARWTGTLTAPATGDYTFTLTSRGRGWMWLDGNPLIDHSDEHGLASRSARVHLVAGQRHDIRVDYSADNPDIGVAVDLGGDVKLGWEVPPGTVMPAEQEAASLAAASDVAIVVVRDYGTEERDRLDLALPGRQDDLVRLVAAANPRTVVVLTTGQPASMPWLGSVAAVLEAWYPGQEQGNAIARILFGDVNPSGKLPITFPRAIGDTPAGAEDPAQDVVDYSEGLLVGYRWFDAKRIEPLFPFGFGLSYTTFRYEGLDVERGGASAGGAPAPGRVAFTLANTGGRAGAEVAQVYLGRCGSGAAAAQPAGRAGSDLAAEDPPMELAGFAKVPLAPGQSARVEVGVAPEAISRWSPEAHRWTPEACDRTLYVASSSRDVRLTARVRVLPDGTIERTAGGGGCAEGGGAAPSLVALGLAWLLRRLRGGSRRRNGPPPAPRGGSAVPFAR